MARTALWLVTLIALAACDQTPSEISSEIVVQLNEDDPSLDTPEEVAAVQHLLDGYRADAIAEIDGKTANVGEQAGPKWRYDETVDSMTDKLERTACILSENEVNLSPPYSSVRAELCLRDSPKFGRDAFVALKGDGQVLCRSYEACTITVRFDKRAAQKLSGIGAADHSTNIFFIRNRDRLEQGVKQAQQTLIEAPFYEAGLQTMQFNTAGFAWPSKGARK